MIRASALYIVIIIALVIGVICSSLIFAAYFYKIQYLKKFRYDQLENNLTSGITILLSSDDTAYVAENTFSLFKAEADSVSLRRLTWGLFDIGIARAFIQKDTLVKIFSFANIIDSSKWGALYLIDEGRPFSLSGKTSINGDVFIPKAGVQQAYVGNQAYEGDRRLIIGRKLLSNKVLPPLYELRLKLLEQYFQPESAKAFTLEKKDSISESFSNPTKKINLRKDVKVLGDVQIRGNVIIYSDTTLTIDSTAILNNILIIAKSINIRSGFHGSCQFFAVDSIHVGSNCMFSYPSCLGVLRFLKSDIPNQEKITIGDSSIVNGAIFTYEKTENSLKPTISIGKNVKIIGQVYSQGIIEFKDKAEIDGSLFTSRFLYRNAYSIFENYLIGLTINEKALSPYYLTSDLIPVAKKRKKVLQWLVTD